MDLNSFAYQNILAPAIEERVEEELCEANHNSEEGSNRTRSALGSEMNKPDLD